MASIFIRFSCKQLICIYLFIYFLVSNWDLTQETLWLSTLSNSSHRYSGMRSLDLLLGFFWCLVWQVWSGSAIPGWKKKKSFNDIDWPSCSQSQSSGKNIVAFTAPTLRHRLSRSWLMRQSRSWRRSPRRQSIMASRACLEVMKSADRPMEAVNMRYSTTFNLSQRNSQIWIS